MCGISAFLSCIKVSWERCSLLEMKLLLSFIKKGKKIRLMFKAFMNLQNFTCALIISEITLYQI